MKQPPINVRLPDDLAEKYRKISFEKDLPVSTLMRWAATVYMAGIESGKIVILPYGDLSAESDAVKLEAPKGFEEVVEDPAKLAAQRAKEAEQKAKASRRARTGS